MSTVLKILSWLLADRECLAFQWVWDASISVSKWSSLLLLLDFKMYTAQPETPLVKVIYHEWFIKGLQLGLLILTDVMRYKCCFWQNSLAFPWTNSNSALPGHVRIWIIFCAIIGKYFCLSGRFYFLFLLPLVVKFSREPFTWNKTDSQKIYQKYQSKENA